jgi:hypothetical protein
MIIRCVSGKALEIREFNDFRAFFEPFLIKYYSHRQIYSWSVNIQFLKFLLIDLFFSFVVSPERLRYVNMVSSIIIYISGIYIR